MGAQKSFGRTGHGGQVKGQGHVQVRVASQGTALAGVHHAVGILFAAGHEPCMKARRYLPPRLHADIRRKHGVEHKGILLRGNGGFRIEVQGLPPGMHPRVGAAGAGDGNGRTAGAGEGLLQHLLHRQAVQLPLPPRIVRTVVFHGQQHPPHSKSPSATISRISPAMAAQASRSFRWILSTRSRVRFSPP